MKASRTIVFGYIRVSTRDQVEDRQLAAMYEFPVRGEHIYIDRQSGKDFDRPAYNILLDRLCRGDLMVIKSIDRLGRNYAEIIEQWRILTKEKGIDIAVLDMPLLDTRRGKDLLGTFIADLVLQLLSFVAENERALIRQRQAEGIAAAQKRGVRFGRPKSSVRQSFNPLLERWEKGELTTKQAVLASGLSESTFYRRAREWKALRGTKSCQLG